MISHRFDFVTPGSIEAAVEHLSDEHRLVRVIGGGTMLVPRMTRGEERPDLLVDPRNLGLKSIEVVGNDIVIGSRATYDDVLDSQLIRNELPLLCIMAEGVTGGRSITGQGTIGGSACYANPASDVPACLAALGAKIRLVSVAGKRDVPTSVFFEGGFVTNRRRDEMASAIVIPRPGRPVHTSYRKVKPAGSSWPILTVACVVADYGNGDLHVTSAIGGLAARPVWGTATVRDGDTSDADVMLARLTSPPGDAWEDELGDREYRAMTAPPVARRVFAKPWNVTMADKTLSLFVNAKSRAVSRDPRVLLIDALRDELGLKAPHIGCLSGDCGACSVLVDGEVRKSCLSLSVACEGREIVTLEGDRSEVMQALQEAFIDTNAFQCGFCTSGMLMAGADLLRRNPQPDTEQIRQAISGNLCRCTGYEPIIRAIQKAAEMKRKSS